MTDLELEMLTTPKIDPLTDPLLYVDPSCPLWDRLMDELG